MLPWPAVWPEGTGLSLHLWVKPPHTSGDAGRKPWGRALLFCPECGLTARQLPELLPARRAPAPAASGGVDGHCEHGHVERGTVGVMSFKVFLWLQIIGWRSRRARGKLSFGSAVALYVLLLIGEIRGLVCLSLNRGFMLLVVSWPTHTKQADTAAMFGRQEELERVGGVEN